MGEQSSQSTETQEVLKSPRNKAQRSKAGDIPFEAFLGFCSS